MFSRTMFGIFSWIFVIIAIIPNATSYSKYGRTCKDIGCRSDETCVMAEDPCHSYSDQCGRYPTCKRISDASCTSMVCGQNEYCKSENGVPKCVKKSTGPEYDETRVPLRRDNPTEIETHSRGSSDTSNSDDQSHPTRSSGLGYPSSSGYPSRDSSLISELSSYPSSQSSSYPSSRSPGYPSSGSSGYPSSGSSGYPSSGSSGYPSSGSSGYPSSGSSGYPSSGSSGYPSSGSSGYPSSGSSGYPASGSSGYPSSGSSGYPVSGSSGYPSSGTSTYPLNAGYPTYPHTSSGYPNGNPSYRSNYPNQNSGYPSSNYPSSNQPYLPYSNSHGYPQNYPQGNYQNQNYATTTKKPGFREQLTNIARNVAEKVLTQAIIDRVTGKQS